jgi:hypothetical protein
MAVPGGYCLNLQHQQQQMKNDCWATCLAIICQWRGVALSRQQILAGAPNIIDGYEYGQMATCAEANKVVKTLSNDRISFALLHDRKLSRDEFVQYVNRRQVVMLCMQNHMWLVPGYLGNGLLYIHNVGNPTGPEPASPVIVARHMVDCMVLNPEPMAPAVGAP